MSSVDGPHPNEPTRMAAAWGGVRARLAPLRHEGEVARVHHWATRWVHWAAAGLLAFAAIDNGDVTNALRDPAAMRFETWVGVAVTLAFGLLWLTVHRASRGSRLPADAPWWEHLLATWVHRGIYLSIAAVLVTGFAMTWLAPSDVTVTGPGFFGIDTTTRFAFARNAHEFMAGFLGWLFAAHVVGTLWHRVVRRDGVMEAISPLRRG